MDPSDALFLAGAATVLVALVGPRLSSKLAEKKRWMVSVGIVLLALGAILGGPDLIRGFRDAWLDRAK
jgi:hypothetical protein